VKRKMSVLTRYFIKQAVIAQNNKPASHNAFNDGSFNTLTNYFRQ
jgi:hypothetical protein